MAGALLWLALGSYLARRTLLAAPALPLLAPKQSTATQLTTHQTQNSLDQLNDATKTLNHLLENFDDIAKKDGGDGIRRLLGTVGTTSPLYRIQTALRVLAEDSSDPETFVETLERALTELQGADNDAYSSNFVTYSAAKATPEDYWSRSKAGVTRLRMELETLQRLME